MTDINEFLLNKLDKIDEKLDKLTTEQTETRVALERHEQRDEEIHNDVKHMGVELSTQSRLLGEYNESLREHMRRTELLENQVQPMHKEWVNKKIVKRYNIKKWKTIVAVAGAIATIVGCVVAIHQATSLF